MNHTIHVTVNGTEHYVAVDSGRTLNELLREDLNLTGTKLGCGTGDCGACTVMVDGRIVSSCLTLAVEVDGKSISTVEGLATSGEQLHPIQDAFIEKGAIQCGFCTAGMEMSALGLLKDNPNPSDHDIRTALAGNLCRCTGYTKIVTAISDAAERMADKEAEGNPS